ncbi:hypothetical protein KRX52_08050 [Pseudomonas sp. MAP12]|uniref:Uncharacterized protein n=1 Tax=Geopseudomonas aromaticivorans TaxID=2849492 RepID=A0ABS6MWW3_9GAMM|nr:hypothetical protein [Pseudomonas aromaticivorans]MBV2132752.1 hypothetical protein [Pseudomonas aromaticivorans]
MLANQIILGSPLPDEVAIRTAVRCDAIVWTDDDQTAGGNRIGGRNSESMCAATGGMLAMKIEKQTLILLMLFTSLAGLMVFLVMHDPYAERSRNEVMNLILPLMNGVPFFN